LTVKKLVLWISLRSISNLGIRNLKLDKKSNPMTAQRQSIKSYRNKGARCPFLGYEARPTDFASLNIVARNIPVILVRGCGYAGMIMDKVIKG
jgi:hypothetical protein